MRYIGRKYIFFLAVFITGFFVACNTDSVAMRKYADVQYANIEGVDAVYNLLDIYAPVEAENCPVVIFIHGGGWQQGVKESVGRKPELFVLNGFIFVSANYRLSPEYAHPAHVEDIASAVAWAHENISEYGGNPERIFLMGHSSGGHLAAIVSTDERYLESVCLSLEAINGTILLEGVGFDIETHMASSTLDDCEIDAYTSAFGTTPEQWRDASPLNHVSAEKGIPPFMIVVAEDSGVWDANWEVFSEALDEAGVAVEVYHAEKKSHYTVNRDLGRSGDETSDAIIEFMNGLM